MFKKVIIILCLLMAAGCSGSRGKEPAENVSGGPKTVYYEVPGSFYEGYEKADFAKFNSFASENGLAGTMIYLEGSYDTVETINYENAELYYSFFTDRNNNKWLTCTEVDYFGNKETYEDMIGHQLLILANYQGYSKEFKMPMVYLKSVFDKETGKTTDSVFYRFAELEEFYINDKKEEKKEENKDTIRPEIKEAIDAYEAFIDEYCDFMKKFAESDMTDAKLLMEYSEFVSKELEMTEKIEALEEDMTDAEEAYYVEVMLRCSAKMLEAAQ